MPVDFDLNLFDPTAIDHEYQRRSRDDFMLFARGLRIPCGGKARLFSSVMADFQRETFEAITPSLYALRDGDMPPCRRFWIERTKKASKDADLAIILAWLIAFPKRPFYAQVAAADKDQAAIVRRRIESLFYYNDWLKALVDVKQYKLTNKATDLAVCDIIAADVAGSHGETPDLLICNELSHVTKWEFIENLLDNADGVPNGIVIIATNAGFKGTKAEALRKQAGVTSA